MTGPINSARGRQRLLYVELLLSVGVSIAIAVVGVDLARQVVSSHSGSRLGQALALLVAIALLYACTRWAIHVEHRLRLGDTEADVQRDARLLRSARRHSPTGLTIRTVIWAAIAIAFLIGMVVNISNSGRSNYVQSHGIRAQGTVLSVTNSAYCSVRGGCTYAATLVVRLTASIDHTITTTVSDPNRSTLATGDPIAVLVDPKQPSYAELPGHPGTTEWQWIAGLFCALLFGAFALDDVRQLQLLRRYGRRGGGVGAAPAPSA